MASNTKQLKKSNATTHQTRGRTRQARTRGGHACSPEMLSNCSHTTTPVQRVAKNVRRGAPRAPYKKLQFESSVCGGTEQHNARAVSKQQQQEQQGRGATVARPPPLETGPPGVNPTHAQPKVRRCKVCTAHPGSSKRFVSLCLRTALGRACRPGRFNGPLPETHPNKERAGTQQRPPAVCRSTIPPLASSPFFSPTPW